MAILGITVEWKSQITRRPQKERKKKMKPNSCENVIDEGVVTYQSFLTPDLPFPASVIGSAGLVNFEWSRRDQYRSRNGNVLSVEGERSGEGRLPWCLKVETCGEHG
jgi:hypothetical protein